jgi:hypothetical protein
LIRVAEDYFEISRSEVVAVALLLAILAAIDAVGLLHHRFDSDEPQHLHVIWGWTHGLVQYRDLFDNHMPLFHLLFAPVLAAIGDRATVLYWMRLALFPTCFVAAWCTFRIGALLFSRRVGLAAAMLVAFYPTYHRTSLEFRADNLWAPLWLLCLVVLINGRLTPRRAAFAGLLLGCAFGISMKTSLLFLSLIGAAAALLLLVRGKNFSLSRSDCFRCAVAFAIGTALVPAVIMLGFAIGGVWHDFRYCVFDHNILSHFPTRSGWRLVIFPLALPLVLYGAHILMRNSPRPELVLRRGFIFLVCGFYLSTLASFWSLITRQDFLPSHPLVGVFCAAGLVYADRFQPALLGVFRRVPLPALVIAVELLVGVAVEPFWIDRSRSETDLLRAVLSVTDPGDYVFDSKGETVFRRRCFRPVLESLTVERIRRGLLVDDAARTCVERRVCVAVLPKQTSLPSHAFIEQNYLLVADGLCIAGMMLKPAAANSKRCDFEVAIAAPYEIVAPDNVISGLLDGTPYIGARFLPPGRHWFESASPLTRLALLWAQAADRNFTPFAHHAISNR